MLKPLANSIWRIPPITSEEPRFTLLIPYPSFEKDPIFHELETCLNMVGSSMSRLIAGFLTHKIQDRLNSYHIESEICQAIVEDAQSLHDSIESDFDATSGCFIAHDPDDQHILTMVEDCIYSGFESRNNAWRLARECYKKFCYYYNNIEIPEDMSYWLDWDYDLMMLNNDTAVIVFKEKENVEMLRANFGL